MEVVIVLPYLNEQKTLLDTCRSLGFGRQHTTPSGTTLLLIDNGSSDSSPGIAQQVKHTSRQASVITECEPNNGVVLARIRGNLLVRELARSNGWKERDVLVLQADADASYEQGYVEAMRRAAITAGSHTLIEACLDYPSDFKTTHKGYFDLCTHADSPLENLCADDDDDVVVVDCVAGYALSDYFSWGEHQREYTSHGDEIYSETTRLFIRAKGTGAKRIRVESRAFHSPRKIEQDPGLHFATAGFPREASWIRSWQKGYQGPTRLIDFYKDLSDPNVERAVFTRKQHFIALFVGLPWQVRRALGETSSARESDRVLEFFRELPQHTPDDLRKAPGGLIEEVFILIDTRGAELLRSIELSQHNRIEP